MAKQSTSEAYEITVPESLELDRMDQLELYYFMALTRKVEERLGILYRQNKVVGGLYSSLGQEACAVGSAYALQDGDFIAPMIRNLGSVLVRGVEPLDVLAQYCARGTSPSKGRDLNLHFGSVADGLIAPISVVGALVPVTAGVALELKLRGKQNVALTYVGDGAMSTADFHEGVNFAAVRRLPLIVVLENNGWAYSTPTHRQTRVADLADRAKGYGMYGEVVDGNNVLAMVDAVARARRMCVAGEGPALIEAKTFRRRGHAEHDPADYVPAQELAYWERRDPIDNYRRFLCEHRVVESEQELNEIDEKITGMLEACVEEVLAAPFPDPSVGVEDVYA